MDHVSNQYPTRERKRICFAAPRTTPPASRGWSSIQLLSTSLFEFYPPLSVSQGASPAHPFTRPRGQRPR